MREQFDAGSDPLDAEEQSERQQRGHNPFHGFNPFQGGHFHHGGGGQRRRQGGGGTRFHFNF